MRLKTSTILLTFVWCLFMGVTAGSIGLGALYPPLNYIAGPFVCPGGQMQVDQQVYNPYPGTTITTLTWYCADVRSGARVELSLFPISLVAGLIYGFLFFVLVICVMWFRAGRGMETQAAPVSVDPELDTLRVLEREEQAQQPGATTRRLAEAGSDVAGRLATAEGVLARMKELHQLRASNLISEAEYQAKRKEILDGL